MVKTLHSKADDYEVISNWGNFESVSSLRINEPPAAKIGVTATYRRPIKRFAATTGAIVALGFAAAPQAHGTDIDYPPDPVPQRDAGEGEIQAEAVRTLGEAARQLRFIQDTMGLSDRELAAIFPGKISRERICLWRNDRESPRPENLYSIGMLHTLATALDDPNLDARTWLHQRSDSQDMSPFEALEEGRLAEVQTQVNLMLFQAAQPDLPARLTAPQVEEPRDDDSDWV